MSLEALYKAMYNFGISTNKAAESIKEFVSHIPPFTEDDILRIRKNPSLSMVAKIRIIRNMRKQMKGEEKMNHILKEKKINPRQCIEETILHFNPDISDKDLLVLREQIYYDVWQKTHSPYGFPHIIVITIYILGRSMYKTELKERRSK